MVGFKSNHSISTFIRTETELAERGWVKDARGWRMMMTIGPLAPLNAIEMKDSAWLPSVRSNTNYHLFAWQDPLNNMYSCNNCRGHEEGWQGKPPNGAEDLANGEGALHKPTSLSTHWTLSYSFDPSKWRWVAHTVVSLGQAGAGSAEEEERRRRGRGNAHSVRLNWRWICPEDDSLPIP